MRFLLACTSDKNLLFLEPVYSLKLGLWSGRLNGLVTSDKKFCFEKLEEKTLDFTSPLIRLTVKVCTYAICILHLFPMGMLLRCCTQRSTATESPICTIAVPSLVFKNLI